MYVPFVNSKSDAKVVSQEFGGVGSFRLRPYAPKALFASAAGGELWLDSGIDGLYQGTYDTESPWYDYMHSAGALDVFALGKKAKSPTQIVVDDVVASLLKRCLEHDPAWVSVPQLPHADSALTNLTNGKLAKATNSYLNDVGWKGERVLPVILTHSNQTTKKAIRTSKVKTVARLAVAAGSSGLWVVDKAISDQTGNEKFQSRYFPKLIEVMEDLQSAVGPKGPVIAGPYWGLGVVMWARGLATHVAAGCGNAYQYRVPGGAFARSGTRRLAIPSLRRWAKATPELKNWLRESAVTLASDPGASASLQLLHSRFSQLSIGDAAKRQTAREHLAWVAGIASSPEGGRALALYQDLSTAYVRGKQLNNLSSESGRARKPILPALQLMTNCL